MEKKHLDKKRGPWGIKGAQGAAKKEPQMKQLGYLQASRTMERDYTQHVKLFVNTSS